MGANCLGCSQTNKKKPKYSIQPEDTSDYNPDKLSYRLRKLDFHGELDNVEIFNSPFDIISIDFKILDVFECNLPRQRKKINENSNHNGNEMGISNRMKWKYSHGFEMRMDEYQIRKSFITISVFNHLPQPVLIQRLNLYQVITGPYHHDIALRFQNKPISRLLFDLKISQCFNVVINPIEVGVHLNQEYPGDEFNYSFNAYKCGQKISASDGSLPQKVLIFSNVDGNYRQLREEEQCQSPTKIRKGVNMSKMIRNTMTSQLIWNRPKQVVIKSIFKEQQIQMPDYEEDVVMPSFKLKLSSNEISKSSLQMILWKIQTNKVLGLSQGIMFADCYITFPKLFESDYLSVEEEQTDGSDNSQQKESHHRSHHATKKVINRYESRICIIQESLIKQGRSVGKVSLKLKVINQIYFSQLFLHARTQDGIVYMNSMFRTYIGKQRSTIKAESINKIQAATERLVGFLYGIINLTSQKKRNWTDFNIMEQKAIEEFNVLMSLLTISIQESFIIVQKHNLEEMMERQIVFMSIVEKFILFLQKENPHFLQQLWKVLLLIIKRGQFYLQNIGFAQLDHSSSSNVQKSNDPSQPNTSLILPKKVRIGLRYQEMMYKILIMSLNYNYESQRDTIIEAQAFKAFGYFRIPKFREEVLKCIVRSAQMVEFGQQTIECLQEHTRVTKAIMKYEEKSSSHLDWQKNFYMHLRNQRKSHQLDAMLLQALKENPWFISIGERKQSFFIFIEYFTKKMAELSKRLKLIRYSYCPGYDKLVKTFLIEMKRKPLVQYQSCMIETSTALLANHSLINVVIPIVVEKTNIYDNQSINQFLNILTSYLKFLTQNGQKTLPQKFNHHYFFKIIKLILQCQYSYAVSKMLVILHTYFQSFNEQFKDVLCLYLLSKAFFRLFFHWSFSIRIIFYHLFIIKIYWSKLNGVTEKHNKMGSYQNENCQIFNRYKKLIKILNTAEKQKTIKKKNMKRAQKEEYYVKMRRKILQKISQNPQNMVKNDGINDSGMDSSSEHSNEKQKTLNLTRLQTLCESKDGYNRSETLCSSEIKEHLKKLQSERIKSFSSVSLEEGTTDKPLKSTMSSEQHSEFGIALKTKHQKSLESKKSNGDTENSVREEIQKLNQDYINKLSLVNRKISSSEDKPQVYTFFGNEDYELEEISLNQENKILMGMEEFRETQQFVQKYILQKGVAPHVNLDPEIELDTSEFKPLEISTL